MSTIFCKKKIDTNFSFASPISVLILQANWRNPTVNSWTQSWNSIKMEASSVAHFKVHISFLIQPRSRSKSWNSWSKMDRIESSWKIKWLINVGVWSLISNTASNVWFEQNSGLLYSFPFRNSNFGTQIEVRSNIIQFLKSDPENPCLDTYSLLFKLNQFCLFGFKILISGPK